jgi:cell division protease FtsH
MERLKILSQRYKKYLPLLIVILVVATVAATTFFSSFRDVPEPEMIKYTKFMELVAAGQVQTVSINLSEPTFQFTDANETVYTSDNPKDLDFKRNLLEQGVVVKELLPDAAREDLIGNIFTLGRYALIFGVMFFILKSSGMMSVHKEKNAEKVIPATTFKDIAGNEEAKEDMEYLVKFLKDPRLYVEMGAKLPKGVVFYGPPGTGKTFTARAMAGEAQVPFYSVSGSDFVEMYVGLGAKRVRGLFAKARKSAPCIIFIDEIDAVGTRRGSDRNSEKDQTINALLNEMDGFTGSEGVLVIAATNRVETLDPALIRAGRFDKHIAINLPDVQDRMAILQIHSQNKKLADCVNLEELSKLTIGFSGAGLETLLNESTILAVNDGRTEITKEDIDDAYYKVVMQGSKKKNRMGRTAEDVKLIAWHEAGHALVAKLITENDIPKVTIVPSTSGAGGATFNIPKKMGLHTKRELLSQIKMLYGGRVAEMLLLNDEDSVTTGARQDIRQATVQLKEIVNDFGMNEKFGMIHVSEICGSDSSAVLEEVTALSRKLHNETTDLLTKNKATLEKIAKALIEKETLTETELDALVFPAVKQVGA